MNHCWDPLSETEFHEDVSSRDIPVPYVDYLHPLFSFVDFREEYLYAMKITVQSRSKMYCVFRSEQQADWTWKNYEHSKTFTSKQSCHRSWKSAEEKRKQKNERQQQSSRQWLLQPTNRVPRYSFAAKSFRTLWTLWQSSGNVKCEQSCSPLIRKRKSYLHLPYQVHYWFIIHLYLGVTLTTWMRPFKEHFNISHCFSRGYQSIRFFQSWTQITIWSIFISARLLDRERMQSVVITLCLTQFRL